MWTGHREKREVEPVRTACLSSCTCSMVPAATRTTTLQRLLYPSMPAGSTGKSCVCRLRAAGTREAVPREKEYNSVYIFSALLHPVIAYPASAYPVRSIRCLYIQCMHIQGALTD
ncbi:hypothetical protein M758_12G103100 [Ceratodon purpureus]|nr:hypothetical protein M758_12G103100 [Ceratodon purpureus]